MTLESMLRKTVEMGGGELRLKTARKPVVVAAAGDMEIGATETTNPMLQQLLSPVMPQAARQALATGRAEWVMRHPALGTIRATAQVASGTVDVAFVVDSSPAPIAVPSAAAESAAAAPVRIEPRSATHEMDSLFRQMHEMGASDLHLCAGSTPMVRHDGDIKAMPGRCVFTAEDVERILWPIAPERNREEFRENRDTDFAYEIAGLSRFRCNFFMDRKGMGAVFRIIPSNIITAEQMGLSKEILDLCFLSKGLVLVTGPTGSGKSTTLCALVDYINRFRSDHIITIEDPIEFVHENKSCLINQRQVGEHTGSFKSALRAALREDPDIVLVGEMRDLETISIAMETAETGHLVFGTLHTSTAASTVDRIIDQFPADRQEQIRVMLSSSLKGVISQMLCKKIGGGRVPALEVMIGTHPVSNMIREGKVFQIPSIMQTSRKLGMCMMNDSLLDLVKRRVVEPQEAYVKAIDKAGLLASFKANGVNTSWHVGELASAA